MDISQLNSYEKDLLISIHNTIIPKRKQNFDKKGILSGKNLKCNTIIDPIIIKTNQLTTLTIILVRWIKN